MSEELKSGIEETLSGNPSNETLGKEDCCDHNTLHNKLRNAMIFNIVLLLAVILLFILHFIPGKGKAGISGAAATVDASTSIKVAYVNNDSIMSQYELVRKIQGDLMAKSKRLEGELAAKQNRFDSDAAYFQEQVKKKTLSEQSAQEMYGKLTQEQQKINDLRQRYAAELQQNQMEMNVVLLDSITNFLKRYNANNRFDYVFGYSKGGNILLAKEAFDITPEVVKAINQEYLEKNNK